MEYLHTQMKLGPAKRHDMPEVELAFVGDVQCGVAACDEERFKRFMEWTYEQGCYYQNMADNVDMANGTDRKRLMMADLNDTTWSAINDKAEGDIERFLGMVKGTEGRWLSFLRGHHFMSFPDGSSSDSRIAQALGSTFLGDTASITCDLVDKKGVALTHATMLLSHGQGSSNSESAALTRIMKWGNQFGHHDIVANGHHHKKIATKKPRPVWTETGEMLQKNTLYAFTGSFLKGYLMGSKTGALPGGGYVEKAMLAPITLGALIVTLRARSDGEVDIDVSL